VRQGADRLGLMGVAPGEASLPAINLIRVVAGHLTAAEQHAGAGGAAARLRAKDRPDALQRPGAGQADPGLAHAAGPQPGEYRRV
jgi:hypothetical protein